MRFFQRLDRRIISSLEKGRVFSAPLLSLSSGICRWRSLLSLRGRRGSAAWSRFTYALRGLLPRKARKAIRRGRRFRMRRRIGMRRGAQVGFVQRILRAVARRFRSRRSRVPSKAQYIGFYRLRFRRFLAAALTQVVFARTLPAFGRFGTVSLRWLPIVSPVQIVADTLVAYALRRLGRYFLPSEVFTSMLNSLEADLSESGLRRPVKGLLVVCAGRFTRQQLASLSRFRTGATSMSTMEAPVDYASGAVSLKYGAVGVKVFLTQNRFLY